jgi:hypothetical protein
LSDFGSRFIGLRFILRGLSYRCCSRGLDQGSLLSSVALFHVFRFNFKILLAIRENLVYYAVAALILATILIYIFFAGSYTGVSFTAFLISLSNAYGLFLCAVLLGYGLVDFPRSVWNYGTLSKRLCYLEFSAVNLKEAVFDAETDFHLCVRVFNILIILETRLLHRNDSD